MIDFKAFLNRRVLQINDFFHNGTLMLIIGMDNSHILFPHHTICVNNYNLAIRPFLHSFLPSLLIFFAANIAPSRTDVFFHKAQ